VARRLIAVICRLTHHQLNNASMSTTLQAAIMRLIAMSSLMLSTQIRMHHQHRRQCPKTILLATIQEPLSLRQLLANTHRTILAISDNRTVVIDGKRNIETNTTVFSIGSAKQPVLITAKEFLPLLIKVLTVAWLEKMPAFSSILSVRQTSVVSTTIPWLVYPLSLRQVS
jgi:hypothetical protein